MAKTSSTGLIPRKNLYGLEHPSAQNFRVGNSATLVVGDVVRINTAGGVVRAAAGNPVLGVVTGLVDENDMNLFSLGYTNNTGATITPDDTVVTSATNTTRANYIKAKVQTDPAGIMLYYNDANGDLALANLGQLFDLLAASDQIDQATASDASGQFQLVEIDPDNDGDASKGLWRVAEPQLLSQIGNSATVIAA